MENIGDQPAERADAGEEETLVTSPKRTEETQEDAETETLERSSTVAAEDITAALPGGSPVSYSHAETLAEKAERKREREKQRRLDLNEAFERLQELVFRINPEIRKEAEIRMAVSKSRNDEQGIFNRLELLLHALDTLEAVHEENEERKMVIQHMARGMLAGGSRAAAGLAAEASRVAPNVPNPAASSFSSQDIQVC